MQTVKRSILVLALVLFFVKPILAHKEWVHQYLVKEAYWYLENKIGLQIPDLKNHIGLDVLGPTESLSPYIATGAWREYTEDIVYRYGGWGNGWSPSCTHFWSADGGFNAGVGLSDYIHTDLGRYYWSFNINEKDYHIDTLVEKQVGRSMFLYSGFGSSEILYFGVGCNFNNKYSTALKTEIFPARGNAEGGIGIKILAGVGLRFSILFYDELLKKSWFPLDNVSFEYSYGFNNKNNSNVNKYQLTTGSDKIRMDGFNFLWAIGIATVIQKNKTPLLLPSIKIGLIYNF